MTMSVLDVTPATWPAGVLALTSTRSGGASAAPWASFNLGDHVGDDPQAVRRNREKLLLSLPPGTEVQWLAQQHGTRVVRAGAAALPTADACWTDQRYSACAVLTADCLPVLLCSTDGRLVAAVHAGWRGLASGVLEATLAAMPCEAGNLYAWLGPCIGADAFEVGPEVRARFLDALGEAAGGGFRASPTGADRLLADLRQLATLSLQRAGVRAISASSACTYREADSYFSYRRDGQTGRMATLVLTRPA
jgi:YfiH family protein